MPDGTPLGSPNRRQELFRELFCGGILAGAFVLFACLSWRTWPDILVDFGQELYVPWRLATGDVLYRDIAWVTGPLSVYYNSLLFRTFGVSLTTLIFANLVLLAAIVGMLYYLFRQCGTRWSATCICLFFLAVFAFRQFTLVGNYNYICPYRHDITHGLALGLVNLLCLARFGLTRRTSWLVASGLSLGLLSLSKIEMTLASGLTTAVALTLFAWQLRPVAGNQSGPAVASVGSSLIKRIGQIACWSVIVAGAALIPIVTAVAALGMSLGWTAAFRHIFLQYRLVLDPQLSARSGFYQAISGWDYPAENLIAMALATVIALAALVAGYVAEASFGRSKRARIWAVALGIVVTFCALRYVPRFEWENLPAAMPVLLAPLILFLMRRAVLEPKQSTTLLLLVAVYGIGLLPKILLRVKWVHYGFVLAMPGTLVLIHVALHSIPQLWSSSGKSGKCFRAVTAGLIAACAIALTVGWIKVDLSKTAAVGNQRDRFYADPRFDTRVIPTVQTLDYLSNHMQPDDSLIVFPNGVMLNYLLRKRNPTPYIMFNPWESAVHGGEDHIANTVIRAAPDYAVIVTMDMTGHGQGNFGSPEFGGRIRKFLDEHYTVVDAQMTVGGADGEFVSTVFKRRTKQE